MRNYLRLWWGQITIDDGSGTYVPESHLFFETQQDLQIFLSTPPASNERKSGARVYIPLDDKELTVQYLNAAAATIGQSQDESDRGVPPAFFGFTFDSPRSTGLNSKTEKAGATQRGVSLKRAGSIVSTKTELALLYINLLNEKRFQVANDILTIMRRLALGQITEKQALDLASRFVKVL